jgi:hypothetical protein
MEARLKVEDEKKKGGTTAFFFFWLRGDGWLVCGNGRKVLAEGRGGLSGWFLVCGEGG